ncbi:MAG: hypothetical protein KGJ66_11000 [Alphaproteobacteria bacterium]|nr:hypothetical protein [Alphaproteobacteria bacterium]
MNSILRRSRTRLRAVSRDPEASLSPVDDIKIAHQRMRHLAPWNVEPLPVMHSVAGAPIEPMSKEARERGHRLALQVLAVHMWHAAATSALQ